MILHLGVIDFPYASAGGLSTGKVAEYLEHKYHIMETFYHIHEAKINSYLEDAIHNSLQTMLSGQEVLPDELFESANSSIKKDFSVFLYTGEMERLGIPGVPTKASQLRRSLRFKAKKAKATRPSFIDTGLYESSFIAWTEEEPDADNS